jgi:hypothetical protein
VEEREQLFVKQPVKQGFSNAGSGTEYLLILLGVGRACGEDDGELNHPSKEHPARLGR